MKISAKRYAKALYGATRDVSAKERDVIIKRFVMLLSKRNALSSAESIIAEYKTYAANVEGRAHVVVTVARKLSGAAEKILTTNLEKRLKQDVTLETHLDPAIIGGAVIRFGDTVIDGSVKRALADLKQSLAS